MNRETETIFSSTGRLGVSRRPYERIYVNGSYCADPSTVEQNFRRLVVISERYQHSIGRSVLRGLVSEAVMQYLSNNGLQPHLEVALPVREFTGDSSWFVYLANNRLGRELIVPHEVMIDETSDQKVRSISPLERVQSIVEQGFSFTDRISEDEVNQIHALWGETFGWEWHQVNNLRSRLDANRYNFRSRKDVWFAAVRHDKTIISAAMAERLVIPAIKGQLNLVESTEWRTRNGYEGNGLMTATVAVLNAQILSDLQGYTGDPPLIYAECNFQSRSDRVGYGAGFRIPDRRWASQILVQNVLVRDGQPIEDGRLRDFTFMYLPREMINRYYDSSQTEAIIQLI